MRIKLDEGAFMPERAHSTDAGLDLRAREDKVVPAGGSAIFDTGVHVELPDVYLDSGIDNDGCIVIKHFNTVGMIKSKSGLNVKHNIKSEGVVDMGYTGSIVVKLYNHGDTDYQVKRGDKISQLVILPIITPELEQVEELDETERGDGGFGSTGR